MIRVNQYTLVIIGILVLTYLLQVITDVINVCHMETSLPDEFKGDYDKDTYRRSQEYLRENTKFNIVKQTVTLIVTIAFILAGGFNWVDHIARSAGYGNIGTGLVFAAILFLLSELYMLPFSVYKTFVIEERYGFNRTTPRTFIQDIVKACFLAVLIGAPLLAAILWFFEKTGDWAWIICWMTVTLFQIVAIFLAPVLIMPFFNRFEPLEEGPLKDAIKKYADSQGFKMKGIFRMDGSKRSAKTNAFFTGFGRFRRIVLYDTLIEQHPTEEIVSILAHEMGHYKMGHVTKMFVISFISTGIMFFLLSLFINNRYLFEAFGMDHVSVYASLVFFGFLFEPIETILSIFVNMISRRHEYEADAYSVDTYKNPRAMINALKKLAVKNLSDLSPHPLKVILEYTHPPVLYRIRTIKDKFLKSEI